MAEPEQIGGSRAHRFTHSAMAAPFECLIADEESSYARQAAAEVFAVVDRVEESLSRYRETSDVARINRLCPGDTVRIGEHAFECLRLARAVCSATHGAFDPTIGPLMACWRGAHSAARPPDEAETAAARALVGMDGVLLDDTRMEVRVTRPGLCIDLGGIGKGYALDRAADSLREWGIERALLNAGESTVLALGAPEGIAGWPVGIGGSRAGGRSSERVLLRDRALSGSGFDVKGRHIMDPRTGRPAAEALAAWALCASAAEADALSTAFMVMGQSEIEGYCASYPETGAVILREDEDGIKAIRIRG